MPQPSSSILGRFLSILRPAAAATPPSKPFNFALNPHHARNVWPPHFTALSHAESFRLERKFRRRAKLQWARPVWTRATTWAQWTLIGTVLAYVLLYADWTVEGIRNSGQQDRQMKVGAGGSDGGGSDESKNRNSVPIWVQNVRTWWFGEGYDDSTSRTLKNAGERKDVDDWAFLSGQHQQALAGSGGARGREVDRMVGKMKDREARYEKAKKEIN